MTALGFNSQGKELIKDPKSEKILKAVKYWIAQGQPEMDEALILGLKYDS